MSKFSTINMTSRNGRFSMDRRAETAITSVAPPKFSLLDFRADVTRERQLQRTVKDIVAAGRARQAEIAVSVAVTELELTARQHTMGILKASEEVLGGLRQEVLTGVNHAHEQVATVTIDSMMSLAKEKARIRGLVRSLEGVDEFDKEIIDEVITQTDLDLKNRMLQNSRLANDQLDRSYRSVMNVGEPEDREP
jgi:hypothetical protein